MITRNIKALLLALGAVLAMGAIAASSASATFLSESSSTTDTVSSNGVQKFQYVAGGIAAECSKVTGEAASSTKTHTSETFKSALTECKTFLGPAHVDFMSCDLNFTTHAATGITVHIECEKVGDAITVTITSGGSSVCTLDIKAQTPGGTITATNLGSGTTAEVEVKIATTGVVSTRTGSSLCGAETSTTGTYSGNMTLTGEVTGTKNHTGISVGE